MSNNQPFQVYLRIRPVLESSDQQDSLIQEVDDSRIVIGRQRKLSKQFLFDHIFSGVQTNQDIFDQSLKHNLDYFVEGYNTTILAYGITGSGKTHTIFGNEKDQGLASLCLDYLINRMKYAKHSDVQIDLSFIEVYNETIRDLLSSQQKPLVILQDSQKGAYVSGLQTIQVKQFADVQEALQTGNQNRALAQTIYNVSSSRSHAIIQVQLSYRTENQMITPKLFIVDLAGSERVYQDQKTKNQQEGSNINRSLLALSNCLSILSDKNKKNQHIPYRNSKLTRLLQDSLGGNTRTIMISCIQQNKGSYDEILNTLQYSSRATQIKRPVHKSLTQFGSPEKLSQLHSDLELNSKSIYLTKIYNDIYTNIGEYYEINQSLIEMQQVIQQNQLQIEEIYSSSLQNNSLSINDDKVYHQLIAAQRENQLIEQQLQHALQINLHQKQLQKSLLLQITEEQQSTISHWKHKSQDLQKECDDLKAELSTKNQVLLQKEHLIAQQQLLIDSIKNPSVYQTNDTDLSYPSSFNSSTSTSQIKKKPSIQSITQQPLQNNNQLQEMLEKQRFCNLSNIKQILNSRDRSPTRSLFRNSPARSPLRKKAMLRNIASISKDDSKEYSELSSTTHKKSRLTTEPHVTTINLFGPTYLNIVENKENTE